MLGRRGGCPRLAAGAAVWLCAAGCGTYRAELRGQVFEHGNARYSVGTLPSEWRRTDPQGGDVAYYNRALNAMIATISQCRTQDEAPLEILAQELTWGFDDVRVVEDSRVQVSGRQALHQVVEAAMDGVPVGMDVYVVKSDGCSYTVLYTAPPSRFAQGERDFLRFVAGLTIPPARAGAETG